MGNVTAAKDAILDLQGELLHGDGATFLKTLDRLLTVGSYYSDEHHQYLSAVESSCADLVGAIAPRPFLALEITAAGVLILDQEVDSGQLHVRKLFDLLVPLNLARLEFQAALTPDDLRATLSALKEARRQLETKDGFREIVIKDLPDTVSIATRQVTNSEAGSLLSELTLDVGELGISAEDLDPEQAKENLAQVFLNLAESLMVNLEAALHHSEGTTEGHFKTPITRAELLSIREGLRRMVEIQPDPEELLRLIRNAKTAVDLSCDLSTVDLAFKVLREEMGEEARPKMQARSMVLEEDLSFSAEALTVAVTELEARDEPVAEPEASARRDQWRIAITLMQWDFESMELVRVLELVEALLQSPEFSQAERPLVVESVLVLAHPENQAGADLLPPLLRLLREHQLGELGGLWRQVLDAAQEGQIARLWPHLVNDLMLGFGSDDHHLPTILWAQAGGINMGLAQEALSTLKILPAYQSGASEPDLGPLMALPLDQTRPVHAVLMKSRFADRHGTRLFRALQHRPFNDLSRILVAALESYSPRHRKLLFALICEADLEAPSPRLGAKAGALLGGLLKKLPSSRRNESWVKEAIALLPSLLAEKANPVLEHIRKERRFLILRAWPEDCRRVATAYLNRRV